MRKPKKRLVRNIRFLPNASESVAHVGVTLPGSRFFTYRIVDGPLGGYLRGKGSGCITFLDNTPNDTSGHFLMIGTRGGILVVAHTRYEVVAQVVGMCWAFRDAIVGGYGKMRWAKLKVLA